MKAKLTLPGRWDLEGLSYNAGTNETEITLKAKPVPTEEFLKELDETLAHP